MSVLHKLLFLKPSIKVAVWEGDSNESGINHHLKYGSQYIVYSDDENFRPSKQELDNVSQAKATEFFNDRNEEIRKNHRNENAKKDHATISAFMQYKNQFPTASLPEFLDYLEEFSKSL